VAVALLALGCAQGSIERTCTPPPPVPRTPGSVSDPVSAVVGVPGEMLSIEAFVPAQGTCPSGFIEPTSITAAVLDSRSAPVPFDAHLDGIRDDSVFATITFTPASPGLHELFVRFEPELGNVQIFVNVAEDRRDAGRIDFAVDQTCDRVAALGATLFCSDLVGSLSTISEGVSRSTVDAADWALTHDGVWAIDWEGRLTRYTLADGGLIALASQDSGMPNAQIIVEEESVAVLGDNVHQVVFSDGGIVQSALDVANPAHRTLTYAFWQKGVALLEALQQSAGFCTVLPDGSGSCVGGFAGIGATSDGIWFTSSGGVLGVKSIGPDGTERVTNGAWNGDSVINAVRPAQVVPIFSAFGEVMLPRLDSASGAVVFENYGGVTPINADERCLWIADAGLVSCLLR
jgi:hypothetical protein